MTQSRSADDVNAILSPLERELLDKLYRIEIPGKNEQQSASSVH